MNLDEYITKMEVGELDRKTIEEFSKKASLSRIFRLYSSYGEAKKIHIYGDESLNWILSSLQKALKLSEFHQASDLLNTDINASFACFWQEVQQRN
ncbi:MAG: hypothetical protein QNJ70_25650 [Xenococcaceae cyanobacterium MO_207.B15]|nr:hypothetical protein [Xenococcaceae cyanobacterium MO_207.B15]